MSSESSSNVKNQSESPSKRVRMAEPPTTATTALAGTAKSSVKETPLEAALARTPGYLLTLHSDISFIIGPLVKSFLVNYSTLSNKQSKSGEHAANPSYVPKSVQDNFGLQLKALSEVEESEEFKTLNAAMQKRIDEFKRELTIKFMLKSEEMNLKAHRARLLTSFCRLLTEFAKGLIAEQGLVNISEHQLVIDFLAMKTNHVIAVTNATVMSFLQSYQEVHALAVIPTPSVNYDHLLNEFDSINGPAVGSTTTGTASNNQQQNNSTEATPSATARNVVPPSSSSTTAPPNETREAMIARHADELTRTMAPISRHDNLGFSPSRSGGNNSSLTTSVEGNREGTPAGTNTTPQANTNAAIQAINNTTGDGDAGNNAGNNGTNDEDNAGNNGTNDEVMADESDPASESITYEKAVLINTLLNLIDNGLIPALRAYDMAAKAIATKKRIKKALKKSSLTNKADSIAAIVNKERPVAPACLRGLIQEESNASTKNVERQLQSTLARLAKVENQLKNRKSPPTKPKPKPSSKNDKAGGKQKSPPSVAKSGKSNKNSPQESAKGTTGGRRKKKTNHSKGKSNGNEGASKSKRHN